MKKLALLLFATLIFGALYAQAPQQSKGASVDSTAQAQAKPKKEQRVLICRSKSSYAYHSSQCSGLSRCKAEVNTVSVSEAKNLGYRACKICY